MKHNVNGQPSIPLSKAGIYPALIIFAVCLGMALVGWVYSLRETRQVAQLRFDFRTQGVVDDIHQHMLAYEQVLRGGVGFIKSDEHEVNRDQWKVYVDTLEIDKNYPGIQGIGYSLAVAPEDVGNLVESIRSEGFPDFKISPDEPRSFYTVIIFLEPFRDRNLRAFGYDMFTNPVRNAAMSRSRDQGRAALSGRVTLVQETSQDVQAGCLLYVPNYRKGSPTGTLEQRRKAIQGWVYAPFRMKDLMHGILRDAYPDLRVEVFDGLAPDSREIMFDNSPEAGAATNPEFQDTRRVEIYGHPWTLRFSSFHSFNSTVDRLAPRLVLAGGLIISVLVFAIALSLARTRARAYALAEEMTSAHRMSEEKLQALFDSVGEGILTLDENGLITSANPAANRIFGYTSGNLIGMDVSALSPLSILGLTSRQDSSAPNPAVDGAFEVPGLRAGGEEFPMDVAVGGMRLGGARLTTLIVRDISERKRLDKLKSEFVSVVSHELRTPLTSIRGALGLIMGGVAGAVTDKSRELMQVAMQNVERLTLLINDILDMEKIDSGRMEFRMESVDAATLIRSAVVVNEQFAKRYETSFHIFPPLPDATVRGDEARLIQVLTNLLSNAAKFSPPGSTVEIASRARGGNLQISVADHGQGIPPDFRGRVFEKFSQADSSDTRQKGGSGLGLAIAKAIVERHGGRIWFDTQIGEGTVFHVELPLAAQG